MNIFQRISKLVTANINHLLDTTENPEVMVKQLIRDMEESIIELRRETVKAIARQKQLEKQIHTNKAQAADLEKKTALALESGDEDFARQIISKKLDLQSSAAALEVELKASAELAEKMKSDLSKLEDQVQIARRKKEELIRRKRSADAKLRNHHALQKSHDAMTTVSGSITDINEHTSAIESFKEKIVQMEAEAEASEELLAMNTKKELDIEKFSRKKAVEEELKKMKKKLAKNKSS